MSYSSSRPFILAAAGWLVKRWVGPHDPFDAQRAAASHRLVSAIGLIRGRLLGLR